MAARFFMLALAALTLSACETARTEDTGVRRGASPTLGDVHRNQIRGPVVADATVAPARARHGTAARRASAGAANGGRQASATRQLAPARAGASRSASVVPNPMRAPKTETTAPATGASAPTDPVTQMSMQTELAHRAAEAGDAAVETEAPAAPETATGPDPVTQMQMQTDLVHQAAATEPLPPVQPAVDEQVHTTGPIDFGLGDITIDKIEAMFGGMPFLLIASIAAALVAALGFALRSSPKPKKGEDYGGPHLVENEDYRDREPYAA